jgi:hypothetical protein
MDVGRQIVDQPGRQRKLLRHDRFINWRSFRTEISRIFQIHPDFTQCILNVCDLCRLVGGIVVDQVDVNLVVDDKVVCAIPG